MNWRGRYGTGMYEVTAKRWWSPRDRRNARLAAKVIAAQEPLVTPIIRERFFETMLYGEGYAKPTWKPRD